MGDELLRQLIYVSDMNLELQNFKEAVRNGSFVYCYLRHTDNTPYYIGIASNASRPVEKHNCAIPKDRRRIRIMRTGLTWEEACIWEMRYISHYGRKDIGTGILRNLTDGGDGTLGAVRGPEYYEEQLKQLRIDLKSYLALDANQRVALKAWCKRNSDKDGSEYVHNSASIESSKRYEIPLNDWEKFSEKERAIIHGRYLRGRRGKELLMDESELRKLWEAVESAERYGIEVEDWLALEPQQKNHAKALKNSEGLIGVELLNRIFNHKSPKEVADIGGITRRKNQAKKYGVEEEKYLKFNEKQRRLVAQRYYKGIQGEELLRGFNTEFSIKTIDSAERYGVTPDWWDRAKQKTKRLLGHRYFRGKRGEELLEGIYP